MKKLFSILLILVFSSSGEALASTARSTVETQVESSGETQVYQSVETTINGQTVKKESSQPGKLELKMEKTGSGEPTVTFFQETATPTPMATPLATPPPSFVSQIAEFLQKLLSDLTSLFR